MKRLTVRLPEPLVSEIGAESRARRISKSDVIRDRLRAARRRPNPLHDILDLVGSVEGLPRDLSGRKRHYLAATGYGTKRDGGGPPAAAVGHV